MNISPVEAEQFLGQLQRLVFTEGVIPGIKARDFHNIGFRDYGEVKTWLGTKQLTFTRTVDWVLIWKEVEGDPERSFRASGDVECGICGHMYRNHAVTTKYSFLHALCDGTFAKL